MDCHHNRLNLRSEVKNTQSKPTGIRLAYVEVNVEVTETHTRKRASVGGGNSTKPYSTGPLLSEPE